MPIKEYKIVVGITSPENGFLYKERENLARTIEELGFDVERTSVAWPRDHYVFQDDKYLVKKDIGPCGEGGFFQLGKDIVLVSERLFGHFSPIDEKKIYREVKKHNSNKRVYIVPTGYDPQDVSMIHGPNWIDHIDLTCLLIPTKKLLVVDESFYEEEYHKREFEQIAKKEDLQLEFYNPKSEASFDYYPLNCLILPNDGEEIIIANQKVGSFVKLLKKYELKVVEVKMTETPKMCGGSIRCCTNLKHNEISLDNLLDFDEE
jgi:hypothetical protein